MENLKYIVTPFVCALIGWFTNYLAVKMLFHPRSPRNLLLFKLHGIFPKRQKELARNLGETIESELISYKDVERHLSDGDINAEIQRVIGSHIDKFLKERLVAINPMIAMFLNDDMLNRIKRILNEEIESVIPDLVETVGRKLEAKLDFKTVVREKVELFDMDRLENLLFSIMKKEFGFIELAGGILGFVIGLVQAAVFYFA